MLSTNAQMGTLDVDTGDTCEDEHETPTWENDDGELCECIDGVAQCGDKIEDDKVHLSGLEAAGIAASCFVLGLLVAFMCFYVYHRTKKLSELPVEGTGTSTGTKQAGEETELPTAGVT